MAEIVFENVDAIEDIETNSLPVWWYEENAELIEGIYYLGKILLATSPSFQAKEIVIPSHIKRIKSFDGKGVIEKLYIPDGVQIECSFKVGCENLKEIRLPADLTAVEQYGNFFWNTPSLEKVVIPEGMKSLPSFNTESGIKELTIFNKIYLGVYIKDPTNTRYYCHDLTTIIYQGVVYTYSAEQPTEEGDYWYVSKDGYFEIW